MDKGHRHLSPLRIWLAADASLGDEGVRLEDTLDFRRIDILATGDNQIIAAVQHIQIAFGVQQAKVSGSEPAILKGASRRVGPVNIAGSNSWSTQLYFPRLTHRNG